MGDDSLLHLRYDKIIAPREYCVLMRGEEGIKT